MKKLLLIIGLITILYWSIGTTGEIYMWTDRSGNIVFSDSPPPYGSFKKRTIEDQIDKVIDQKKEIDKDITIDKSDKISEKLKIEMDYQKKAKAIRDYNAMREELRALEEKYQKKYDELRGQWDRNSPRSSGRHDIIKEGERLNRDYRKEIRQIKEYYGYY